LKSIDVGEEVDHCHINAVYGYANFFSEKPSRIKAVAKSFAVCYYLEHHDMLECILKSSEDFERYFEIKHKVELL
jgi:signal-transduction protein with cAMP-binding, CBS, and nucleotidyltransferase domain